MNDNVDPDIDDLARRLARGEISVNGVRKTLGLDPLTLTPAPKAPTLPSQVAVWIIVVFIIGCAVLGLVALAKLVL